MGPTPRASCGIISTFPPLELLHACTHNCNQSLGVHVADFCTQTRLSNQSTSTTLAVQVPSLNILYALSAGASMIHFVLREWLPSELVPAA